MPWPARQRPAADVAATGQGPRAGRVLPDRRLSSVRPWTELQELDREFDVPQATLAQFDLPIRLRRWDVVLDPSTHRLGVGHEVVTSGGRPHEGSNRPR